MAFTLKARIGRGRTTETFSARLSVGGEQLEVAVKRPRPELAHHEAFVSAFLTWAEQQKDHEHENLVAVLEAGRTEEGAYVIQERVEGPSLTDVLHALLKKKRTMTIRLTLFVAERIAAALGSLHDKRIAHGGLDPGEVLFSYQGEVKVTDQRLRALDVHLGADLTDDKTTALYRAPELTAGKNATPASDMYSLSLVILEMLIGKPVWTAPSMTVEAAIAALRDFTHVGQAKPSLTEDLTSVLLGCAQDNPDGRVQSGRELVAGIQRIVKRHKLETNEKELAAFVNALLPSVKSEEAPTTMADPAMIEAMERARVVNLEKLEGASVEVDPDLERKALSRVGRPAQGPQLQALPRMATKPTPKSIDLNAVAAAAEAANKPRRRSRRAEIYAGIAVIILIVSLMIAHMVLRTGENVRFVEVRISSDPPNAAVFLDGEHIGQTPISTTLPLRADEAQLRFILSGYVPLEVSRKVQGETLRYDARLSPE